MKHRFLCNCSCHTNSNVRHVVACCRTYTKEECTCKDKTLTAKRYCPWHGVGTHKPHHEMYEDLVAGRRIIHPITGEIILNYGYDFKEF